MSNKRKLERAGFTPESVVAAVAADDLSQLKHTGKVRIGLAPEPEKVTVGFLYEDEMKSSFVLSFIRLLGFDAEITGRVWSGGFAPRRGTTGDLAAGRNDVVADFLKTDSQWLWWVDTDMGFEPDVVERLLEAADPIERPVVGALCFAQREHVSDGVFGWRAAAWPVLLDWNVVDGKGGFDVRWDYPRNTLTRCSATGSACILVHRSVFERMRDEYGGDPNWSSWYSRVTNPTTGALVGEDFSFCLRLLRLEIPLFVHTGVQTTHQKNIWLQEEDYWRQRALDAPPPETAPIPTDERAAPRYAVVPTHNRPDSLQALVASLGKQVDRIVVLDNASDPPVDWAPLAAAALPAVVEVIRDEEQPPHLSRFWNVLFDRAAEHAAAAGYEVWDVAAFNDDAIVPAGWFDVCSTALRVHDTAVVAHTGSVPVHRAELVDSVDYPRNKRMCPWAFMVRGEAGLRADESLVWWYFDDQFNREAALAGGVLAVPGPLVVNAQANVTTVGVLAEQAEKDRQTFVAKWSA
jgi:GT2 family glycosyltransferase